MTVEFTVIESGRGALTDGRTFLYAMLQKPGGETMQCVFPPETFEWRAAEYGLTDPAEILDVILHEMHLAPPERENTFTPFGSTKKAAAAKPEPPTLYTATSTQEAREAHLQRIADTKANRVRIVPPKQGPDPLDGLRAAHGMTAEGIRAKAALVDTHRWERLYGGLPKPPKGER